MLIGGLGPTAVEGRFRVAAELTLGVMRNDRGLLLGT
jgi:phosphatidylinositol kinase/protein kinase (PI-3  family)